MFTITRRFTFDAAHRVLGHTGKCRFLHGHRYEVEVSVYSTKLNDLGMVIDFAVVKEKVGSWIDEKLDHNILLHPDDPLLELYMPQIERRAAGGWTNAIFNGKNPFIMPGSIANNPTAENIASLVYTVASRLLEGEGIIVSKVRVWETANCYADYPGPPIP